MAKSLLVFYSIVILIVALAAGNGRSEDYPFRNTSLPWDERVKVGSTYILIAHIDLIAIGYEITF